ncbi:MAG: cob(I)yrinic acid a,c-diamide adenosyltransferase [Thermovirgaceae bacterium]|nr:cob(I)yrinic acid a,c-diamide adenosyltransferase [Thermovirgaceae bacterium]
MTKSWITTKDGDKGTTSLGNGTRVPKDHPRVNLYGTIDECQAAIGLARASCCTEGIREELLRIENDMGSVMGYLALFPGIPEPDPATLEEIVEKVHAILGETFRFVRPGDSLPGAALHLARTIARRAERLAVALHRDGDIGDAPYAWINRLSDAIYALSLWTDKINRECEENR